MSGATQAIAAGETGSPCLGGSWPCLSSMCVTSSGPHTVCVHLICLTVYLRDVKEGIPHQRCVSAHLTSSLPAPCAVRQPSHPGSYLGHIGMLWHDTLSAYSRFSDEPLKHADQGSFSRSQKFPCVEYMHSMKCQSLDHFVSSQAAWGATQLFSPICEKSMKLCQITCSMYMLESYDRWLTGRCHVRAPEFHLSLSSY